MDNLEYRPGLHKLIHHQDHLGKIERGEVVGPIHVSIFPNNFCQLDCPYCCFGETSRTREELSYQDFISAINVLKRYGLKALEFSGGGDPLLWTAFPLAVRYGGVRNLKMSLVTNGLALKEIPQDVLKLFTWIRVSVQSAKYARSIAMDYIPNNVKKSMSFIVHNLKRLEEVTKIYDFAKETHTVIRVAPNRPCTAEWEQTVLDEVNKFGYPLVAFKKESGTPLGCYMLWIRAAINWKGEFLPCPSIELSPEYAGKIPDTFGVCKINNLEQWLINNPPHDLGYRCSFCNCGKDTNDYIYNLKKSVEDVDFV